MTVFVKKNIQVFLHGTQKRQNYDTYMFINDVPIFWIFLTPFFGSAWNSWFNLTMSAQMILFYVIFRCSNSNNKLCYLECYVPYVIWSQSLQARTVRDGLIGIYHKIWFYWYCFIAWLSLDTVHSSLSLSLLESVTSHSVNTYST